MGKERSVGDKALDNWEKLNWITMAFSLLFIGGSIGLTLAAIDASQIALTRYLKKKRK